VEFKHRLDAQADALFLSYGPREAYWLQRLRHGDEIVCCNDCRKVFYAEDWQGKCPFCGGEPLAFRSANHLLLRERVERGDGVAEWAHIRATRVRRQAPETPRPEESAELLGRLYRRVEDLVAERDDLSLEAERARAEETTTLSQSAKTLSVFFTTLCALHAVVRTVMFISLQIK
jgi:hypothetical protein